MWHQRLLLLPKEAISCALPTPQNIIKSLLLHALFLTEMTAAGKSQSGELQDCVFCFDWCLIISPA
jgi:hypothetical protein